MAKNVKYDRVLLKLSGESLCNSRGSGIQKEAIEALAEELRQVDRLGTQVGLVIGGGNILRGRDLCDNPYIGRTTGDYMGMLATIINAMALRDMLTSQHIKAEVLSPIADPRLCETYSPRRACELLSDGYVTIFAGGTGSPFFTTDTCAALRASEIGAQVLLKATTVDGVYDSDPRKNPAAKKYATLSYAKTLADKLGVMDLTAISLCMENRIPIMVFKMSPGNLAAAMKGQKVGTIISQ